MNKVIIKLSIATVFALSLVVIAQNYVQMQREVAQYTHLTFVQKQKILALEKKFSLHRVQLKRDLASYPEILIEELQKLEESKNNQIQAITKYP